MPIFRKILVFISNLMRTSVHIKFVLFSVRRHSRSVLRANPFFKQKFLFLSRSLREGSIAIKNSCDITSEGCIQNKKPVSSQHRWISLFQTTNCLYVKTDIYISVRYFTIPLCTFRALWGKKRVTCLYSFLLTCRLQPPRFYLCRYSCTVLFEAVEISFQF